MQRENIRRRGFEVRDDVLRDLRLSRGWTREHAAHLSGLSDKLIWKAESGRRIDGKSVAALAALYSTAERPLVAQDLLCVYGARDFPRREAADSPDILSNWLHGIWNQRSLATIERLSAPSLLFHCELGVLTSPKAVCARVQRIWAAFDDFQLTIDRRMRSGGNFAYRWKLEMMQTGPWLGMEPGGQRLQILATTTARIGIDGIEACWEFWSPQPAYRELSRCASEA